MKQVTRQLPVQGAKHIIWDVIIDEAAKLIPYLDYILHKDIVMQVSRQSVTMVNEVLNNNPIDTANNTISFLNGLTKDYLKEASIKDIILVITWERKVMSKHQHLDTIKKKFGIMNHQIKLFNHLFAPLCKRGLPFFWGGKGKMLSQKEYHDRLVKCRLDHRNFEECNNPYLKRK